MNPTLFLVWAVAVPFSAGFWAGVWFARHPRRKKRLYNIPLRPVWRNARTCRTCLYKAESADFAPCYWCMERDGLPGWTPYSGDRADTTESVKAANPAAKGIRPYLQIKKVLESHR